MDNTSVCPVRLPSFTLSEEEADKDRDVDTEDDNEDEDDDDVVEDVVEDEDDCVEGALDSPVTVCVQLL